MLTSNLIIMSLEVSNDSVEFSYFKQFLIDHSDLTPYRTEWCIWDENLRLAGSVDMVYIHDDNTVSIYDWKRSKEIKQNNSWGETSITPCISHLPDCNFFPLCSTTKYLQGHHREELWFEGQRSRNRLPSPDQ